MPSGSRRVVSITGILIAIIVVWILQLGFLFRLIPIQDAVLEIGFVRFTASGVVNSCMSNWVIFGIKNIIMAVCFPSVLTIIRSPVVSEKVTKMEERLFAAAYHLKEASKHLEEESHVSCTT